MRAGPTFYLKPDVFRFNLNLRDPPFAQIVRAAAHLFGITTGNEFSARHFGPTVAIRCIDRHDVRLFGVKAADTNRVGQPEDRAIGGRQGKGKGPFNANARGNRHADGQAVD